MTQVEKAFVAGMVAGIIMAVASFAIFYMV